MKGISMNQDSVVILGITIHNLSMIELLEKLNLYGGTVVTPNVDHLMRLQKEADFREVYKDADYAVCDSKIVQYASYFLGQPIREKISGSDLFPAFCQYNKNNQDIKIFLLGGKEGVARQAQIKINKKVGREIVVESYSPSFGFEKNEAECQMIVEKIRSSGATVLAVGVGAPKQEKWIFKYKSYLPNIKIFLSIGATIDFEAGCLSRSPQWVSAMGIEWLYRLAMEPKRLWKRYLVDDLPFLFLILKQKFFPSSYEKKFLLSSKKQ
jgi:N-acetylglucosaminyldiphosphoundecaprenol N-acetyl-beta-D-mannosaminyltransferase